MTTSTALSTEVISIGRILPTTALAIAVDILRQSMIPLEEQQAEEDAWLNWLLGDVDPAE